MQKIIFIGAGSMAEALIHGWIKKSVVNPKALFISNRSNKERLQELVEAYNVNLMEDISQLHDADLVILAMKPKDARAAMEVIAPHLGADTAILSVLAGVSIETIEQYLGSRPIARVMPNTSATIGMSASGIAFNKHVTTVQHALYIQMLEAVGIVIEVEEEKLHAVTALSGSGPAYLYYLVEAFEQAGAEYGLSKEIVRELMVQTIAGSAEMLKSGNVEPQILRKKVTSPGGTTEAGIKALESMSFNETIANCVRSAENRSRELARGE
ncbi:MULTISPECIES: pyrroline-5-carboxylate reductase [Solibacillus]|uniref:Pyrroline-5-carboxylate reductase n=1 Tax=Solibacillus merdavium TaxID=2762218 RepID=A0ABR8XRN9_9BACL|nr:pyrroline-5-carboxylate reductase [Solibacillus merdavium]MBD8034606.1 pyrroline-5-carboxylate reductase [Solibacillus merdavium]